MPDSGTLLALDLGGTVGWACAKPGGDPVHGSVRLPGDRGDAAYFDFYASWLEAAIAVHAPRLLVYEAPIITGAKTHFKTAFRLIGLSAITLLVGHKREVPRIESVNNATVKKQISGDGRAKKRAMIDEMWRRGWSPKDEHAADALGVLLVAEARFAPKTQRAAGPLFFTRGSA
ncbi:MAG: hypothetical protein AB7H90_01105 [Alphaproteobacteria bacterium]